MRNWNVLWSIVRVAALSTLLASPLAAQTFSGAGPAPIGPAPTPQAPLLGCMYMPNGVSITDYGRYGCTIGTNGAINVNVVTGGGAGGGGGSAADQTGSNATDAQATRTDNQHSNVYNYLFNGTTWDRARGTSGAANVAVNNFPALQPVNNTQWAGTALGAPTSFGTAPTGNVPGTNAFVTNFPTAFGANQGIPASIANAWPIFLTQGGAVLSGTNGLPTTDTNAASTIAVPGTAASKAQAVQGPAGGAVPVTAGPGTTTQAADVAVPAGAATQILATTARKYLSLTNTTATGYCRIAYSGVTPTATRGDPLAPANVANGQGGGRTFESSFVPSGTVSAYCTAASTIAVMEGN